MGWDTVDELLCKFYNWKVVTDTSCTLKHLKPTGANYIKQQDTSRVETFIHGIRFMITAIASARCMLYEKKKPLLFLIIFQKVS
jgi:hypothetical protein